MTSAEHRKCRLAIGQAELGAMVTQAADHDSALPVLESLLAVAPRVASQLLTTRGDYRPERMCLEASRHARALLAELGLSCELLEGDVVLEAHESLEHYVLLHEASEVVVIADFTASQLPWFSDDPVVLVTSRPTVPAELKQHWHWFVPTELDPTQALPHR